jgi:hypothetical protein
METASGSAGAEGLRRGMAATNGLHVVMVADEPAGGGDGVVYGLFECHQAASPDPGPSPERAQQRRQPKRRG